MMKKYKLLIFFLILVVISMLVSCQAAQPTVQPSELPVLLEITETSEAVDATSTVGQEPTAYPAPELNSPASTTSISETPTYTPSSAVVSQEAYPGPAGTTTILATATTDPYPGPQQTPSLSSPTLQPDVPTATSGPGLSVTATGTLVTPTFTPTFMATPGLVQTALRATNPEDFVLASGGMQLVEFFAFWSPTSKSMAPLMYSLEEKYQGRILFSYLDVDDPANSLYKTLLGDRLPPVFFLLDSQGTVLAEFQGYVKPEEFESAFVLPPLVPSQAPTPAP